MLNKDRKKQNTSKELITILVGIYFILWYEILESVRLNKQDEFLRMISGSP